MNNLYYFDPMPLKVNLPRKFFDFDMLDAELKETCFSIAGMINISPEPILFAILECLNCAMRSRYKIHINKQWIEKSSLYMMLIGTPGATKSELLKLISSPFYEIQNEINAKHLNDQKKINNLIYLAEQTRKNIAKDYREKLTDKIKSYNGKQSLDEIKQLIQGFEDINKIIDENIVGSINSIRYLVSDKFTETHLLKKMRDSGGGQAIISTEARAFVNYIKKCQDVSIFNKSYDLEPIDSCSEKNTIHIDEAFLNILLIAQTKVASDFFKNKDVIGTGLGSRFIAILLDENNAKSIDIDYEDSAIHKFKNIISEMIRESISMSKNHKYHNLSLSQKSNEHFKQYFNDINDRKNADYSDIMLQTLNRTPGLAIRFASTFQSFNRNSRYGANLEERYMLLGIKAADYAFYSKYIVTDPREMSAINDAKAILNWVYEHNCREFDSCQIQRRSAVRDRDRIFAALDVLESKKYIAQIKTSNHPRRCGLNPRIQTNSF